MQISQPFCAPLVGCIFMSTPKYEFDSTTRFWVEHFNFIHYGMCYGDRDIWPIFRKIVSSDRELVLNILTYFEVQIFAFLKYAAIKAAFVASR